MDNFLPLTIYDASAGAGKTFTIVKNYLSILLQAKSKDYYRNILAITFTNKAVGEMKLRIIESLKAFSQTPVPENHQALLAAVQQQTKLSEEEIQQKSADILKRLLHNYAAFEVSTIDGFTHRILRTFAKELEIPLNFEVALDIQSILQRAVDRLIAKAGTEKQLTKVLIDYAISKADDDKSWDIGKDLFEISKLLTNEDTLAQVNRLSHYKLQDFTLYNEQIKNQIKTLKEACIETAKNFFKLLENQGIEKDSFSGKYVPKYFEKTLNGKGIFTDRTPNWITEIRTKNLYPKKASATQQSLLEKFQPEIASYVENTEKWFEEIYFYEQIQKSLTPLSLLTAIQTEVTQIKKENNQFLISEFNTKISEQVVGEPTPFIYERLGERYQHFFIDEFQDTSVLQWQNLIPLVGHSITTEIAENKTGSLHLVGDAKQSIYRWRGGKAEQFIGLSGKENPFPVEKSYENLGDNYRSSPAIVNFNNSLFSYMANSFPEEKKAYKNLYKNAAQHPQKTTKGFVELTFLDAKNNEEADNEFPEEVEKRINKLIESNYAYKDICILVRKNKQGLKIASHLSAKGIPLISSESLLLVNSPKVKFLVALLQNMLFPNKKEVRYALLNEVFAIRENLGDYYGFITENLRKNQTDFYRDLSVAPGEFKVEKALQLPLYDIVEYAIRSFQLTTTSDAYVQFFLDEIFAFTQKNHTGILGFLDYWEERKDKLSISSPEGENAVQIMSIHKSKGLEFPIVIYPYVKDNFVDLSRDNLWVDIPNSKLINPVYFSTVSTKLAAVNTTVSEAIAQLLAEKQLDTYNLQYVAFTRAEQQLYILSSFNRAAKSLPKETTFEGVLINYLQEKQLWEENKYTYQFGVFVEKTLQKEEVVIPQIPKWLSSNPETKNIQLVTKSGALWQTKAEKAIEEGEMLHELLRKIILAKDVDEVVENAYQQGLFPSNKKAYYYKSLKAVVTQPELALYFSDKVTTYTEKEIIHEHKFKRLDRLCIIDNEAIIIDYKTGNFYPKHLEQITSYAAAIKKMGYTVKEKLLVYLSDQISIKKL
ncbi:MAG: UvrD-helicase domain-containing protein [Mesonia hippocampi]|uniref:UvrD-helicase domain-containing protein n=1 Tax=Mesonia hippocampi TaxID=1628250 RepID=UPI003F948338